MRSLLDNLSICIPTYNRYDYLLWTLGKLRDSFPNAEIIVSDNASTDRTPMARVRGDLPHFDHYLAQSTNIGPFPNMLAALEASTRKYAVYCADDDYLLPAQIEAGIAYLESHPTCAAYCAPCEVYDEVNQKTYWNAWAARESRSYALSDARSLFNFLIQEHIWPEHIIYRTPVPLIPRTRAYWAFADLPDLLKDGDIFFSNAPFYRNLLVHPVGLREQLGNTQCLTNFDEYRAGLEVLAHGLFGADLPYAARHKIQEMIASFICARMAVAARLYRQSGHEREAIVLESRLSIADPRRDVEFTTPTGCAA